MTPMAVAVEMNFRGSTMEQYDQILQKMGLTTAGQRHPKRFRTGLPRPLTECA